jgi:flagellar motor protein MotB
MTMRFLGVLLSAAALSLMGACCTTTPDEEATMPDRPAVDTAGWDTHPAAGGNIPAEPAPQPMSTAESRMENESLRAANRRLMDQVARLMSEVESMKSPPASEAPTALSAPAAAPAPAGVDLDEVRRVLRDTGNGDLRAALNPVGEIAIIVPGSICFQPGKADLMSKAKQRLRSAFAVLASRYPSMTVRVEGHTDSDPIRKSKWASNQALSEARARAVQGYLVSSTGLGNDQVIAAGFGESRPIAGNDTRTGKAQNRRVEIVLVQ